MARSTPRPSTPPGPVSGCDSAGGRADVARAAATLSRMPPVHSSGVLLFRRPGGRVEVLLGHMGGPFWATKDDGAWSIAKGSTTRVRTPKPPPAASSPRSSACRSPRRTCTRSAS
ncbi:conserved protein of unknown function [Blastococcus saxobsidens DD2]|uniref:NUDIX hydrolase n=1 Tax=Blastococcus saxobsidens (strain DD2) TaxID=1146883 RepID=H6RT33_BLASD|nr:conserved protein of unknown function [Blastococcus saxobsidens DD2]